MLQRYVLRQLLPSFLAAFLALSAIVVLPFCLQYVHRFEGMSLEVVLALVPYGLPDIFVYVLPAALLIASVFVFGRMSAHGEVDAVRCSGIPLERILASPLLLGLVLSLVCLLLNHDIVPFLHYMRREAFARAFVETILNPSFEDRSVRLDQWVVAFHDVDQGAWKHVFVRPTRPHANASQYHARECVPRYDAEEAILTLTLRDGRQWPAAPSGGRQMESQFEEMTQKIDLSRLITVKSKNRGDFSRSELEQMLSGILPSKHSSGHLLAELHRRYAQSFAPVLAALVGSLIGILLRKGSFIAGLAGLLPIGVLYAVGHYVGAELADSLTVLGWAGPWLGDLAVALVGAVLSVRILRR